MRITAFPPKNGQWHIGGTLSAFSRGGGWGFRALPQYPIPVSAPIQGT